MEVTIVSEESVKPSKYQTQEPLKLNLLDQLTPSSYIPIILFYLNNNTNQHFENIASQLKQSLSEALSIYYPLSGRVRDNYEIHDFYQGVPFIETRVKCKLHDFLRDQGSRNDQLELMNDLFPVRPDHPVPDTEPQVVVQLNVFECGGLALGMCFLHKTHDGAVVSSFVKTWSTINNDIINGFAGNKQILLPDFSEGVLTFPPVRHMPPHYVSQLEGIWFTSGSVPTTRRFIFDADSISRLKSKAKSKTLENPTRSDALSAFIWKCIISSSKNNDGSNYYIPSVFYNTVNLRPKTRLDLSPHSFGNMILSIDSKYDPQVNGEPRIDDLASLVRNGVSTMSHEFLKKMTGEKGSQAMLDFLFRSLEDFEDEQLNVVEVSCWHGFGLIKTDFGWGPAVWVGLSGRGATGKEDEDDGNNKFIQNQVLIENSKGGIEAWLTLEESLMKALEKDPDFLEFASAKSNIVP
ncbi:BAHD acyltransferase At5g47980 [Linum perenne]